MINSQSYIRQLCLITAIWTNLCSRIVPKTTSRDGDKYIMTTNNLIDKYAVFVMIICLTKYSGTLLIVTSHTTAEPPMNAEDAAPRE